VALVQDKEIPAVLPDVTSPFGFAFQHVQLSIPQGSEDACRRFYLDVLGWTEVPKPAALAARGGLWMRADSIEVHLGVEEDSRPAKKAHPAFLVTHFDALVARLEASHVAITWDNNVPGVRRLFAHDNLGNRLELIQAA
jgi:catechol 2,3-dioxygenase-like lactoylglutathione lyase family enzyme